MSTSVYSPSEKPRKSSTTSRHRRSTVSLHSTPGLGLIKTISRDLVTGWHTHTALQKEPSTPTPPSDAKTPYKPKHAARDALKNFDPATSCTREAETVAKNCHERSRQDSLVLTFTEIDGSRPLARVEEGLIPDHRNDTWTAVWDTAYERRKDAHECPFPCPLAKDTTSSTKFPGSASPAASTSPPTTPTIATSQAKRPSRSSRPPLSSSFSVTDAEIRAFIFENRKTKDHESPEAFLVPKSNRKGSEVPSIVPSLVSSEDSQESGLEDLEKKREEEEKEGLEEVEAPGKQIGKGGDCMHCLRCGGCTRRLIDRE